MSAIHVTTDRDTVIILVIDDKDAYLVNCERVINQELGGVTFQFGYLCPCCVMTRKREEIMAVLRRLLEEGGFEGKVRWCSHQGNDVHLYGNSIDTQKHTPLDPEMFCAGDARRMSEEAKTQFRYLAPTLRGRS